MDILWIVLGIIFILAGIAGCILPFLPGTPLCFAGLWMQQLKADPPFTIKFLVIWALVTLAVTVLDYVVPLYGTKKFGGTSYGVWGATIGLIAGFWFGPAGIILGPFVGAFIGELLANSSSQQALKAAFGSFVGFLFGTMLKLVVCLVMVWYFITAL